jgi:hypothetical protein
MRITKVKFSTARAPFAASEEEAEKSQTPSLVAGPFEQISEFPRSGYFGELLVSSVSAS